VKGKIVVFGAVAVLVAGAWFAFARNGKETRIRFSEWRPRK
jgi:hypothetical protein